MLTVAASVRAAGYITLIVHNMWNLMASIDPLIEGVLLQELSVRNSTSVLASSIVALMGLLSYLDCMADHRCVYGRMQHAF
jgi:hypothetical protein